MHARTALDGELDDGSEASGQMSCAAPKQPRRRWHASIC
jgi:hypothetical protein